MKTLWRPSRRPDRQAVIEQEFPLEPQLTAATLMKDAIKNDLVVQEGFQKLRISVPHLPSQGDFKSSRYAYAFQRLLCYVHYTTLADTLVEHALSTTKYPSKRIHLLEEALQWHKIATPLLRSDPSKILVLEHALGIVNSIKWSQLEYTTTFVSPKSRPILDSTELRRIQSLPEKKREEELDAANKSIDKFLGVKHSSRHLRKFSTGVSVLQCLTRQNNYISGIPLRYDAYNFMAGLRRLIVQDQVRWDIAAFHIALNESKEMQLLDWRLTDRIRDFLGIPHNDHAGIPNSPGTVGQRRVTDRSYFPFVDTPDAYFELFSEFLFLPDAIRYMDYYKYKDDVGGTRAPFNDDDEAAIVEMIARQRVRELESLYVE